MEGGGAQDPAGAVRGQVRQGLRKVHSDLDSALTPPSTISDGYMTRIK